jgi:hypothetical protein
MAFLPVAALEEEKDIHNDNAPESNPPPHYFSRRRTMMMIPPGPFCMITTTTTTVVVVRRIVSIILDRNTVFQTVLLFRFYWNIVVGEVVVLGKCQVDNNNKINNRNGNPRSSYCNDGKHLLKPRTILFSWDLVLH